MKSRTMPPIESSDTPYACSMRNASEDRALTPPQYKTSLTPPSWPTGLASDSAAEQKLARAELSLDDVARREQILLVQIKAHRHCTAELAEERALFEAEQANHAKKVKQAEEALIRMRAQLALESQTLE